MENWQEYKYTGQFSVGNGDIIYRPMIAIDVSTDVTSSTCFSMIDSGTDDTLIDADFAKILGIDESQCEKTKVGGVIGQTSGAFKAKVKIKIEGFDEEFETEAIFVHGMFVAGLLGQKDIFDKFKIRFEKKHRKFYLLRDS